MSQSKSNHRAAPVLASTVLALAACGTSDGGSGDVADVDDAGRGSLSGVVAVGAALPNAEVSVTDINKTWACVERPITTSGTGAFTCTVAAGTSLPYLVVVTDPSGAQAPLVSIATQAPAAGAALVVNATPLTTAIVAQLVPNRDPLALVEQPSLIDATALQAATRNVLAQLAPTLSLLGAAPDYDPFSTPIVAATGAQGGNTADLVLETLRFSTINGVPSVATVDNPGGAVPLAGPDAAGTSLAPPSAAVSTLSSALRQIAGTLDRCFALPVAERVVAADTSIPSARGGPAVTQMAPACDGLAHANFLHNGFTVGQWMYRVLNDATMVGAKFSPPEVMRYVEDTSAADADEAIVNLRYTDALGVAGNVITIARKFPGTQTPQRPSDWWLYGNQDPVDSRISAFLRRFEQVAPNPGTAPFVNAAASRFETGLVLYVGKDGPGSEGMRAARYRGPGLPLAGVVLTRPDPGICTEQNWMNIRRKDGLTDEASASPAASNGNFFRLQRTQGVTGGAATSVRANPNATAANTTQVTWAHPLDYGAPVGAGDYIDFTTLRSGAEYTLEIFYDGEVAPRHTIRKSTLTPVMPAPNAAQLQWVSLSPGMYAYLDPLSPLAAPQTSIDFAWVANPYAPTILSGGFYSFGGGQTVTQGQVAVARGATSAVAAVPGEGGCTGGQTFPALTADGVSYRQIQLRYRVTDGGYKDTLTRYN